MTHTHTLRILLVGVLMVSDGLASRAQLVFIPDTNLRVVLNVWVPGSVDVTGYLDPANPDVQAVSELEFDVNWSPADLTGLGALDNLTTLSIGSICFLFPDSWYQGDCNQITIDNWPPALASLALTNGTWGSSPPWPVNLSTLSIGGTVGFSAIPALPAGLTELTLSPDIALTAIPDLPPGLNSLSVRIDPGVAMPAIPVGIMSLSLSGAPGSALPPIPESVTQLNLSSFDITTYGDWPDSLLSTYITNLPNLTQLDPMPDRVENIGFTLLPALTTLPAWPDSLEGIFLGDLPVTELPALPDGLQGLDISRLSSLHCLPLLPEGMANLFIDIDGPTFQTTPISCLPNLPQNMSVSWDYDEYEAPVDPSLLCTILNSTCDFVNPAATGTVYWDQNTNGTRDVGEPGYPFTTIHVQPGNYTYGVQQDGDFELPLPIDTYTLTANSSNPYVQSISPASHAASFVAANDVDTGNDFGVVLQANIRDLRIDLMGPWGRPGFDSHGTITYQNVGSLEVVEGNVMFFLDEAQSWVSSTPAPESVNGNSISWVFNDLQVGESRTINLTVHTDPGVAIGTLLEHMATLPPIALDQTPSDNISTSNAEVVGSFDPNDKRAEPTTLTSTEVAMGAEITYTIRFQNTGTYQADRVVVEDQLSEDLQWNTMRSISSSHPCTWVLLDNGTLRFMFDPIVLPDSTSDEPGSHGFVKFAMRPQPLLMVGESVTNTAGIIFDYNAPVVTNEAVVVVETSTAMNEPEHDELHVWPNPVGDVLTISTNTAMAGYTEVLDLIGRVVLRSQVSGRSNGVDVASLASGTYTLRIHTAAGPRTTVFVKR